MIVNSVPFQLPATVEAGQAATLRPTLDPYVVQCLYSKVWQLREAAILKVEMILPELEGRLADHLSSLWQVCVCGVVTTRDVCCYYSSPSSYVSFVSISIYTCILMNNVGMGVLIGFVLLPLRW